MKAKQISLFLLCYLLASFVFAQNVTWPKDNIIALTSQWNGERFDDGRPKVSDGLLERLKAISMEEIWAYLKEKGYNNQFENFNEGPGNPWMALHEDQPMTGRVVTAQYTPFRPDLDKYIQGEGKKEKNPFKITNSAPINILREGDVYVADSYGKVIDGTLIGDNLGNAIWAASKRGFIFNGAVRDLAGLLKIEGFNGWYRGADPSFIKEMSLTTINGPIRIGRVTVLPGDVVMAKNTGVIFIPSFLVGEVVIFGEYTHLLDEFTIQRINEGKYEYKNEGFVGGWTKAINDDFLAWLNHYPNLPMPKKELDEYIKAHPHKIAPPNK